MKTIDNEITKISQSAKSYSNDSMNDNSSDGHNKQLQYSKDESKSYIKNEMKD